jgi:hypothetical protein
MFNLGILYLDAPAMPGFDPISQRMIAIRYLESYLDSAPRGSRDDSAEAYIKDARSAIEREQRRQKKKPSPSPEGAP